MTFENTIIVKNIEILKYHEESEIGTFEIPGNTDVSYLWMVCPRYISWVCQRNCVCY